MKTKILIVDDDESALQELRVKVERALALHPDEVPNPEITLVETGERDGEALKDMMRGKAQEHWDALLVDFNLGRHDEEEIKAILLPLELVKAFREANITAISCVYSGTIQTYLTKLFNAEKDKKVEKNLRTIIEARIAEFVSRDDVPASIVRRLLDAPWSLRVERQLLATPGVRVEDEDFPVGGVTFAEIAASIRRGDSLGHFAAEHIIKQGVAAVATIFGE